MATTPDCLRCATEQLLTSTTESTAPTTAASLNRPIAFACLIVTAACWGSAFRLTEIALDEIAPLELTFLRCAIGAITVGVAAMLYRSAAPQRDVRDRVARARAWRSLVIGGICTGIAYAAISIGLLGATSTTTGVILGTVPVWTALFALVVSRAEVGERRASHRLLSALALGTTAAVIPAVAAPATAPAWAVALLLGAALAHAGSMVSIQPAVMRFGPLNSAAGVTLISMLLVAPAWLIGPAPSMPSTGVIAAVLALGILPTGLAYVTFFEAVRRLGARTAALAVYLIPAFALLVGWLSDPRLIGPATLAGAAFGAAAVALGASSSVPAQRPAQRPAARAIRST